MVIALVGTLLLLLALGFPVAFAMTGASAVYLLLQGDIPLVVMAQRVTVGVDSFVLLAIPFFFLAGELMNQGGITQRLMDLAQALVGGIRGGLGHVTVVTNMIMAGMSGSSVADATGTGAILIPAMQRAGYPRVFSAALVGAASTIGPVIPPSIPFVIFGGITGISVGRLFLGGVVPGVLMALFMMAAVYVVAQRRGYRAEGWLTLPEALRNIWRAIPVMLFPVIILGGIFGGVVTPTEAAVIAVVYAVLLAVLVYRELTPGRLVHVLATVAANTAKITFIIASASLYGWLLAREGVPQLLTSLFLSISREPWAILLMLNVMLLFLGCLMETTALLVILTPVLMDLVTQVGIDPVHFGVVFTLNLMIGLLTPPVGMTLYVMVSLSEVSVGEFTRECAIFMLALLVVLILITYIPDLVTFLPQVVMGR
ncbi:MAG TPA: TRAP transporter large permease [Candidatus Methylomirabilis sp.]|nr:TRAP transporter large permease [Candidatus Methylomirabilis sp.]